MRIVTFEQFQSMKKREKKKIGFDKILHLIITSEEIRNLNFSKIEYVLTELLELLNSEDKSEVLKFGLFNSFFHESLVITVSGYINDSRELYEIEEVAIYFKKLFKEYPEIFYFLKLEKSIFIVLSLIEKERKISNGDIRSFEYDKHALEKIFTHINGIKINTLRKIDAIVSSFDEIKLWNEVYLPLMKFLRNDRKINEIVKRYKKEVSNNLEMSGFGSSFINDGNRILNVVRLSDIYYGSICNNCGTNTILLKIDNQNKVDEETSIVINEIVIDVEHIEKYSWLCPNCEGKWKQLRYDSKSGLIYM